MRIYLEFAPEQSDIERARLRYAFAVFCAIYGHIPLFRNLDADSADFVLTYSTDYRCSWRKQLHLLRRYRLRPLDVPAPPPTPYKVDGERTFLFYSDESGAEPDWLAEIFEWISCADEYAVESHGRLDFSDSYIGRYGLNPGVPYAAIALRLLHKAICRAVGAQSENCGSPVSGVKHFIVNTHDVDFLPFGQFSSFRRMLRNAAAAMSAHRKPRLGLAILGKALVATFSQGRAFGELSTLLEGEQLRRVTATYLLLGNSTHRHDANYDLEDTDVLQQIRLLRDRGMEIAVHGSYCSLDTEGTLSQEFNRFRNLGMQPLGNRQHWLRFTLRDLIPAVENAGALYDASLGWTDILGFRAGACFPFPPYNFAEERPARFLELPLAVMDVTLIFGKESHPASSWPQQVQQVLDSSRQYGWGGISVVWHSTAFGGGQIPEGIGDLFWSLLDEREKNDETWLSAANFLTAVRKRYEEAGLWPEDAQISQPAANEIYTTS